ncbi:hypothetical protein KC316_g251 [Hortaea werneckii]|nr:hypothetical protein KC324_g296 [Hortaea werneckii]KAI7595852.1 hypothetical protein KC316_g251 [Hortaea werneckii]
MRHTEDSDTLTRILSERFTLSQEDVAKVWNHVVKLTWEQSSEDRAPHMLYNRHVKGYGGSVKARATYAAVYDGDSPSKDVLEKREVNRARIARDCENAMTALSIAIQARYASYEGDATRAGTKRKMVEEQTVPTASQRHNANVHEAEKADTSKRQRFDRENFYKDITAAYKDRTFSKHANGYIKPISKPSSEQISTTQSTHTPIAMDPAVLDQRQSDAFFEDLFAERFDLRPRQDRLDMVHAHDLRLKDTHIFFDGKHVIPRNRKIYLLGGKALRVIFGDGEDARYYDVMMCRLEICSYCQHFVQDKTGEPPTLEMNTLEEGAYTLQGRPFVHTTDCKNISERPNHSELQFQGTRKDALEGLPQLRDPSLPKCEVLFQAGRSRWKKVEVELCGQCGHCPKLQYQATSRYGPGFYESHGRPSR